MVCFPNGVTLTVSVVSQIFLLFSLPFLCFYFGEPGVLDAVGKEKEEDVSTLQAMRFW